MTLHRNSVAAGLFLLAGIAQAQVPTGLPKIGDHVPLVFGEAPKDGEFRKVSNGIVCIEEGSPPDGYGYCLRLGSAKLGLEFRQLQAYLSKDKRIPQTYIVTARVVNVSPEGVRTILIPISATESSDQLRLHSYIVATVLRSGQVDSLQLTGMANEVTEDLPFSSIKLGSPKRRVLEILGFPSSVADVQQIKGTRWSYAPFPFSIELVDEIVHSIRIYRPAKENLQKPFVPLRTLPN
jgi:hypothetical protein